MVFFFGALVYNNQVDPFERGGTSMHRSGRERKNKPIVLAVAILSILTAGLVAAGLLSASDSIGLARESTYEKHDSGFVIAQPGS